MSLPVTLTMTWPEEWTIAIQRSGNSRACGAWRQLSLEVAGTTEGNTGDTVGVDPGGVRDAGRSEAFAGVSTRAIHAARRAPKRSASCRQASARAAMSAPANQSVFHERWAQ